MIWNIHITQQAQLDIIDAADYIEFVLFNPDAADSLLDEVEKTIGSLSHMPDRIHPVDDPILLMFGIRFIMVKNYLLFYAIDEENTTVYIVRFLHNKQNWKLILEQGFSLD